MNYSFISRLTDNRKIKISSDVARFLYSNEKGCLWYLYCPCNNHFFDDRELFLRNDLILTPVAPSLWPYTARLTLLMADMPGAMNILSNYLRDQHISIIFSKSFRSFHKYATWELHIVFESLIKNGQYVFTYDPDVRTYSTMQQYLDDLVRNLNHDFGQGSFANKGPDQFFLQPLAAFPNHELHHLHYCLTDAAKKLEPLKTERIELQQQIETGLADEQMENEAYRLSKEILRLQDQCIPKLLTLDGEAIKGKNAVDSIQAVIEHIAIYEEVNLNEPFVLCELNYEVLCTRITLIPQEKEYLFYNIEIHFEITNPHSTPYSCLGIIAAITDHVTISGYNIINSGTHQISPDDNTEIGIVSLLVEDIFLAGEDDEQEAEIRKSNEEEKRKIVIDKVERLFTVENLEPVTWQVNAKIVKCHVRMLNELCC
jgi:hypothetical protein